MDTHGLILDERKKLTLTGVTDVDCFNEREIRLYTELAALSIKGSSLHINEMSVESGGMVIEGMIDSIVYGDKLTHKPGLKERLFR
ncbi:MAG: YabP/YqfC family sporulation protein [Ruminococcus sp.]|nr:YabP/YqfC family sporulation protein [Ruminococcus sp.]